MEGIPKIKLYGADHCGKTGFYKQFMEARKLPFQYLDVTNNKANADELRHLYKTGKLNFPTITIGSKKLRNPTVVELNKWINKMIPQTLDIVHDKDNNRFTMDINGELAKVEYSIKNDKMYLVHSEVPYNLRGKGIGKVLVEKTFELLTREGHKAIAVCSYIKAVAKRSEKWSKIISH